MLFTLAALGLPGTSGFIGEFLVLMGAFKDNFLVAVIASFRSNFWSRLHVVALQKGSFWKINK